MVVPRLVVGLFSSGCVAAVDLDSEPGNGSDPGGTGSETDAVDTEATDSPGEPDTDVVESAWSVFDVAIGDDVRAPLTHGRGIAAIPGGALVLFLDGTTLRVRRYLDGGTLDEPTTIADMASWPTMSARADGAALVVYAVGKEIWSRTSTDGGVSWAEPVLEGTAESAVVTTGAGWFGEERAVAWGDGTATEGAIYARVNGGTTSRVDQGNAGFPASAPVFVEDPETPSIFWRDDRMQIGDGHTCSIWRAEYDEAFGQDAMVLAPMRCDPSAVHDNDVTWLAVHDVASTLLYRAADAEFELVSTLDTDGRYASVASGASTVVVAWGDYDVPPGSVDDGASEEADEHRRLGCAISTDAGTSFETCDPAAGAFQQKVATTAVSGEGTAYIVWVDASANTIRLAVYHP